MNNKIKRRPKKYHKSNIILIGGARITGEDVSCWEYWIKNKASKLEIIEETACSIFGIKHEQLREVSRNREVVYARYVVWYLIMKDLNKTVPPNCFKLKGWQTIARMYGMNHATVIHGVRLVSGFLDVKDPMMTKAIEKIEAAVDYVHERISIELPKLEN